MFQQQFWCENNYHILTSSVNFPLGLPFFSGNWFAPISLAVQLHQHILKTAGVAEYKKKQNKTKI